MQEELKKLVTFLKFALIVIAFFGLGQYWIRSGHGFVGMMSSLIACTMIYGGLFYAFFPKAEKQEE